MRENICRPLSIPNPQSSLSLWDCFLLAWRQWGGGMVGVSGIRGDVATVLHPRTHTPKWRGRHWAEHFGVVRSDVQSKVRGKQQGWRLIYIAQIRKLIEQIIYLGLWEPDFSPLEKETLEEAGSKEPRGVMWCWKCWYEFIETHLLTFIDFSSVLKKKSGSSDALVAAISASSSQILFSKPSFSNILGVLEKNGWFRWNAGNIQDAVLNHERIWSVCIWYC